MQELGKVLTIVAFAVALAACSRMKQAAPTVSSASTSSSDDRSITRANTVSMTAIVEDVDVEKRTVTLRTPDDGRSTIVVSEEVKNLPQVHKGDQVQVSYFESLVIRVRELGEAKPGVTTAGDITSAPAGQKPAGSETRTVTVTATVVKIDKKAQTVSLRGGEGETRVVPVENPANLEKVKVGDLVEFTYTQAVAISVEPASAKTR